MSHTSAFKTPEGEAAYLAAYDATLKLWPAAYEEIEIQGRFGMTHIVVSGPENAPPLVLLHGFMNTLLIWSPNIADLSKEYRVYAIDVMGHPSKSIPDEAIGDTGDYVEWLSETLNRLHLDHVFVMGLSFGGWLALNLAIKEPERVRKLVLLSPAASFLPIVKQFAVRGILSRLPPQRYWFDSFMGWMGFEYDQVNADAQRVLDLMYLGGMNYQMSPETMRVMPTVFSDEELRGLRVPVLLLIGENEVIYDAAEALARARRLIPDVDGELVPGCSHDMSFSQYRIVDARVLDFLKDTGSYSSGHGAA